MILVVQSLIEPLKRASHLTTTTTVMKKTVRFWIFPVILSSTDSVSLSNPPFFPVPARLSRTSVLKVVYYPQVDNRCFESHQKLGCLRTALKGNATAVYVLASAAARWRGSRTRPLRGRVDEALTRLFSGVSLAFSDLQSLNLAFLLPFGTRTRK